MTAPAGPVNHCEPVPAIWMPKSVPLRASTVTTVDPGMPAGGQRLQLRRRHHQVEEEVVVAADEPGHPGHLGRRQSTVLHHGRQQVAQQHEGAGPVAVVALVAHLHHLADERPDVDRPDRRAAPAARAGPSTAPIQRSRSMTSGAYAP